MDDPRLARPLPRREPQRPLPITRVELDHVRPSADPPPHRGAAPVDAVAGVRDPRQRDTAEAVLLPDGVARAGGQRLRRDEEARAGGQAAVDGVADGGVAGEGAFGAEVAVGGVAGEEGRAAVVRCADDALGQGFGGLLVVG